MKIEKNTGPRNRAARLIPGIVLLAVSAYNFTSDPIWLVGIAIGLFLIFEGAYGWCIWHGIRGTNDMT